MAFLPVIAAVASVAGTAMSAISASNNADYQSQVAENNAIAAEQNAQYARRAGEQQAAAQSLKGADTAGKIQTAIAANGVDVNTGSAVDVEASQRQQSKLDTETVLNNADLQAYGYRTQAVNFQAQSQLDSAQSSQALIGGGLGAIGGLASAAKSVDFSKAFGGFTFTGG